MTSDLQLGKTKDDYRDLLAELSLLSRDLLLAFRLQAGKLFLDRFFGGSAHAYRDRNPYKEATFAEFVGRCKDELSAVGISAGLARQCIQARIAWDGLPAGVRESLKFNHVVSLARVGEPNMRARLAFDASSQGWTVSQLDQAIRRAGDGSYYDTDPSTPGTQPPPARPQPAKGYQPGRLITRLVKTGQELQGWRTAWATVDAGKLRGPQRQRVVDAVAALEAQVAQLKAELAAGEE